jgi:hypothetical protein
MVIIGLLASGPVGSIATNLLSPQPSWISAAVYIDNYESIQVMPFFFGFILLFGFLLFFSSLPKREDELSGIMKNMMIYSTGLYAFMISLNYFIQMAIVPNYISNELIVGMFATLNPKSIFWYLEMTGYGFLGIATSFAAYFFHGNKRRNMIRYLLIANGILSVAGSILTFIFPGWVMEISGLASYVLWNVLCIMFMMLILIEYK